MIAGAVDQEDDERLLPDRRSSADLTACWIRNGDAMAPAAVELNCASDWVRKRLRAAAAATLNVNVWREMFQVCIFEGNA